MAHRMRLALALVAFGAASAVLTAGTAATIGTSLALDPTHPRIVSAVTGFGTGVVCSMTGVLVALVCVAGATVVLLWRPGGVLERPAGGVESRDAGPLHPDRGRE